MMEISSGELKFAARWAALGSGVPPGLADDWAAALQQISGLGFNPVKIALPVLRGIPASYPWGQVTVNAEPGRTAIAGPSRASTIIALGPIVADIWLTAPKHPIIVAAADRPLLLIGYLLAVQKTVPPSDQERTKSGFALTWCQNGAVCSLQWNGSELHFSQDIGSEIVYAPASGPVEVASLETGALPASSKPLLPGVDIHVSESDWRDMWALTSRGWVKSTAQSRLSGAGAGIVDRD